MKNDSESTVVTNRSTEYTPPPIGESAVASRHAFYLPTRGESIFAWYRENPGKYDLRQGVLICPPAGHELVHTHRSLRVLAERLAEEGFPVLSIDLHGTGDSPGSNHDRNRIDTWINNIEDAVTWLKNKAGCERVTLLGFRFGATLAALASARQKVDDLVLWAPIANGRQYARELKVLSSVTVGRDKPPPKEGENIEPAGFVMTAETLEQVTKIDLHSKVLRSDTALIVSRDDLPEGDRLLNQLRVNGCVADQIQATGFAEMVALPHYCKVPSLAINAIVNRLSNLRGERRVTLSHREINFPKEIAIEVPVGEAKSTKILIEKPLHLSESPNLFGMLTGPAKRDDTPKPLVIFINAGASYRIGANRLYVELSRNLAAKEFSCLRLDLTGLGDSLAQSSEDENISYPNTFQRDVDLAIRYSQRELGFQKVILIGLCAGAYHSYRLAARYDNPSLIESIAINPLTFHWKEGIPNEATVFAELRNTHYYLQSAFRWDKWLKLFSGKTDIGFSGALKMMLKQILRRRKENSTETDQSSSSNSTPQKQASVTLGDLVPPAEASIPSELAKISLTGRKITFFFSRSDYGLSILLYAAKRAVKQLKKAGVLELKIIEDADHTFSVLARRNELITEISKHLLSRY